MHVDVQLEDKHICTCCGRSLVSRCSWFSINHIQALPIVDPLNYSCRDVRPASEIGTFYQCSSYRLTRSCVTMMKSSERRNIPGLHSQPYMPASPVDLYCPTMEIRTAASCILHVHFRSSGPACYFTDDISIWVVIQRWQTNMDRAMTTQHRSAASVRFAVSQADKWHSDQTSSVVGMD
jgi:hypothetical protein